MGCLEGAVLLVHRVCCSLVDIHLAKTKLQRHKWKNMSSFLTSVSKLCSSLLGSDKPPLDLIEAERLPEYILDTLADVYFQSDDKNVIWAVDVQTENDFCHRYPRSWLVTTEVLPLYNHVATIVEHYYKSNAEDFSDLLLAARDPPGELKNYDVLFKDTQRMNIKANIVTFLLGWLGSARSVSSQLRSGKCWRTFSFVISTNGRAAMDIRMSWDIEIPPTSTMSPLQHAVTRKMIDWCKSSANPEFCDHYIGKIGKNRIEKNNQHVYFFKACDELNFISRMAWYENIGFCRSFVPADVFKWFLEIDNHPRLKSKPRRYYQFHTRNGEICQTSAAECAQHFLDGNMLNWDIHIYDVDRSFFWKITCAKLRPSWVVEEQLRKTNVRSHAAGSAIM
tara:strand:+ start:2601 stop:3779 length:1179 start_codon:yes stop_codon:yes gene_type:complete